MSRHPVSIFHQLKPLLQRVDHEGLFLEIPWDYIDSDGVHLTYLFRKDGRLHITRNGEVSDGRWEFLAPLNSLLLSAGDKQRLFQPCLVYADAVLVLQQHGMNKSWILLNPLRVPGLDILDFIRKRQSSYPNQRSSASTEVPQNAEYIRLKNGKFVELKSERIRLHFNSFVGATAVYKSSGRSLPDGKFNLADNSTYIQVRQGVVIRAGKVNYPSKILPLVLVSLLVALVFALVFWQLTRPT